jgi:tetratricopeptide (TPR) repeat protein
MSAIGATIYEDMAAVDRVLETVYKCQLAVTLALARARIPSERLELQYNYPNTMLPEAAYALPEKELAMVRIFHYLGTGEIDKRRDFADRAAVARLLRRRDLNRANQAFQAAVRRVHYRSVSPLSLPRDLIASMFRRGEYTAPSSVRPFWDMVARGEEREAFSLLAPFRRSSSVNSDIWYLSALAAQRIGRLAEAELWYARALVLGHNEFWVRFHRAPLYLRLGKQREAQHDLLFVMREKPQDSGTRALIRHFEAEEPSIVASARQSGLL